MTTDTETALALLDDDPDEPLDWWPDEDGDQIVGVVQHVEFGQDEKYNRPAIGLLVREPGGQLRRWVCNQTVAVRMLGERDVQVGDALAARFNGKRQGANGREYADWTIKVIRAGKPVRARSIGAAQEPPAIESTETPDPWAPADEEAPPF